MTNTVSRIISDETLSRIIHIESGGRPNAKNPDSSASGLAQFISSTWLTTVNKHQPGWAHGLTSAELLGLRFDPKCSIEMLARFTEDNAAVLGHGWTDGDLYLAHFSGVGTARKVMRSESFVPAARVFSAAAVAANQSILEGKSCGEVRDWAARKMAKASGRNWVAVYWSGAKPTIPPKTKAAAGTATAGGAGTVAAGVQQGWGPMEWLILIGCVAIAGAVAFTVWRWWKKRNTPVKIEREMSANG